MVERRYENDAPTLQVDRRGRTGGVSTRPRKLRSHYQTARGVAYIVEFLGWMAVVAGVLIAILGASAGSRDPFNPGLAVLMATAPGLATVFSGLVMVALAQVTRATADNADHTRQILELIQSKA